MAKLQGLSKIRLLWRHNDVMDALNLENWSFFENTHQNTQAYQILPFYLEKQQSYKAFDFLVSFLWFALFWWTMNGFSVTVKRLVTNYIISS